VTALQTPLRWISTIAAAILVASFGLFAIDEAQGGAETQVARVDDLNAPAPSARTERQREAEHSDVREAIDDAADVLLEPFSGVVDSSSVWAERGVATLLAFLAFFVLLRIVAGYVPARR
jgi:hypothetical protein